MARRAAHPKTFRPEQAAGAASTLRLVVSPYHLTTRELPATVALMLADAAVTLVPEPAEGRSREAVREAVSRVPRLLRVLESWRWSGPLWRAGLVGGTAPGGEAAFVGVAGAERDMFSDALLASITGRALQHQSVPGDQADRWLDAVCTDLLKGGPDPLISTAIAGALDRLAGANGLVTVRGPTESLAQRAEVRLMRRVFSIALPVMSRAAGGRIALLRIDLRKQLAELRSAMLSAFSGGPTASLAVAAASYTEAFEEWFARASRDDENTERTMRDYVNVSGAMLPPDAAFISARAAVRGVSRATRGAGLPATALPPDARTDQPPPQMVRTLIVRPMNVRPV